MKIYLPLLAILANITASQILSADSASAADKMSLWFNKERQRIQRLAIDETEKASAILEINKAEDLRLIERAKLVSLSDLSKSDKLNYLLYFMKKAKLPYTAKKIDTAIDRTLPQLPIAAAYTEAPVESAIYIATISPIRGLVSSSPVPPSPSPETVTAVTSASPARFINNAVGEPIEQTEDFSAIFGKKL